MKKKEADFGALFRHWLRANPLYTSAFELKQTNTNSIPFSALEEHQSTYLQAIRHAKGVLVRVQGVNGEPDYIWLNKAPACVVIKYPTSFSIIGIDAFLLEKEHSKRKSLTEARAKEISTVSVDLRT